MPLKPRIKFVRPWIDVTPPFMALDLDRRLIRARGYWKCSFWPNTAAYGEGETPLAAYEDFRRKVKDYCFCNPEEDCPLRPICYPAGWLARLCSSYD
jgi:hypothetical protein